LAVVKLTTVHVTELPLWHKIRKIGMAKPVLTEDLYVVQKKEFSITCNIDERPSIFIIHTDYYGKDSLEKKSLWSWVLRGLTPRPTDWR
jgi:hypothetical protein